jgi:nucleotidyltransferase/DNA polymerase involved in DNA repair
VLLSNGVDELLRDLPIGKLRGLGGMKGEKLAAMYSISTVGQLRNVPRGQLANDFGESDAEWLSNMARGEVSEPVQDRRVVKTVGNSKTFFGEKALLRDVDTVKYWLLELSGELYMRLNEYKEQVCWFS